MKEIAIVRFSNHVSHDDYDEQRFVAYHMTQWCTVDDETFTLLKQAEQTQGVLHHYNNSEAFRIYERIRIENDQVPMFLLQTVEDYKLWIEKSKSRELKQKQDASKKKQERSQKKEAKTLKQKQELLAQLKQELGEQ